jgi:hypothetical protein
MGRLRDWWTIRFSHQGHLTKAAGVSSVLFMSQHDTWAAVIEMAAAVKIPIEVTGDEPERREEADDLPRIMLTGVNLVQVLQVTRKLWSARQEGLPGAHIFDPGQRAIAKRVHMAIARALDNVEAHQHEGDHMAPIVIDDRARSGSAPTQE